MKAEVVRMPPCKLNRGQLLRVPASRKSWVIGYHVCCPRCGFVTFALCGRDGLVIDESVAGEVSFSKPIRCLYCAVSIRIDRCQITLEEDEHVRSIRYR